tara:strand:+ start:96 stop:380 length:285 start_codon:yes stop_codon:yes gene_type:complete
MKNNNVININNKDKEFFKIQERIAKEIEYSFEDLQKFEKTNNMNWLVIEYFLFFWTRVMMRYGQKGEKFDNSYIIKMINKIMSGDIPRGFPNDI